MRRIVQCQTPLRVPVIIKYIGMECMEEKTILIIHRVQSLAITILHVIYKRSRRPAVECLGVGDDESLVVHQIGMVIKVSFFANVN